MKYLRWAAVPLASTLSWYATFFVGFIVVASVPCPPDLIVSGACTAWWHSYVVKTFVVLFAGVAAFLVVLSAVLVAPSHRLQVGWLTFIVGCVAVLYFAFQPGELAAFVVMAFFSAVLSGLLAVLLIAKRLRAKMPPNKPLQPIAPKDGAPAER